jgi:SAM-dependent methyltransferase
MNLMPCRICNNAQDNHFHAVTEMMYGTREEFTYVECSACGSLQIVEFPNDLSKYYPADYYSFGTRRYHSGGIGALARKLRNAGYFLDSSTARAALDRLAPNPPMRALGLLRPTRQARILDIGCGAGDLINALADLGFTNLLGIDPFLQADVRGGGLEIRKCPLEDLRGTLWDVIMLHHSFEHMPDPAGALRTVAGLLSESGSCLIRIPVVAWAWKTYGANWVEMDAPRHLHLHTQQSMALLAKASGLRISHVEFDSDEFQFWGSELYKRGIALSSLGRGQMLETLFSAAELKDFRSKARRLNAKKQGDRAAFFLTRQSSPKSRCAGEDR